MSGHSASSDGNRSGPFGSASLSAAKLGRSETSEEMPEAAPRSTRSERSRSPRSPSSSEDSPQPFAGELDEIDHDLPEIDLSDPFLEPPEGPEGSKEPQEGEVPDDFHPIDEPAARSSSALDENSSSGSSAHVPLPSIIPPSASAGAGGTAAGPPARGQLLPPPRKRSRKSRPISYEKGIKKILRKVRLFCI